MFSLFETSMTAYEATDVIIIIIIVIITIIIIIIILVVETGTGIAQT